MQMKSYRIQQSKCFGQITLPSSKSHTLRALTFALLATGVTKIQNPLPSPDVDAMIKAIELFGAKVVITQKGINVFGVGAHLPAAQDVIYCGNSGIVYRFMTAIAALLPTYTILTGDESIRTRRPIEPLLEALRSLQVMAISSKCDGKAPIIVKGPLMPGRMRLCGEDSQLVSSILIAGSFARGPIELYVDNPKELAWVDLTLDWLKRLNIPFERMGYTYYKIFGQCELKAFEYTVPGDLSSLAFPLVASLITHSSTRIDNIDFDDCQGDKELVSILQSLGAQFEIRKEEKALIVLASPTLNGGEIDCDKCIDAVPILAVLGCFCSSPLILKNCENARFKESDRLSSITLELKKMGASIEEHTSSLIIRPSSLYGAKVYGHKDHRIAMALSVAGLRASGETLVEDVDCVAKTYQTFAKDFKSLGVSLCEC